MPPPNTLIPIERMMILSLLHGTGPDFVFLGYRLARGAADWTCGVPKKSAIAVRVDYFVIIIKCGFDYI